MSTRHNPLQAKARQARRNSATAHPELTAPSDGIPRITPKGVTSPPVKQIDPVTQALIEDALRKKHEFNILMAG